MFYWIKLNQLIFFQKLKWTEIKKSILHIATQYSTEQFWQWPLLFSSRHYSDVVYWWGGEQPSVEHKATTTNNTSNFRTLKLALYD